MSPLRVVEVGPLGPPDLEQHRAVERRLDHERALGVGEVQMLSSVGLPVKVEAVRAALELLAPGRQEPAVPVEDDDGAFPRVVHVDVVLGVDANAVGVAIGHPLGQGPPAFGHAIRVGTAAERRTLRHADASSWLLARGRAEPARTATTRWAAPPGASRTQGARNCGDAARVGGAARCARPPPRPAAARHVPVEPGHR
jgi:hypothetical protein